MNKRIYQWAVIGAGPAGIAALGKLLDSHIPPEDILWIDPHFKVGDMGLYWRHVSSNTKVKYFNAFLHALSSFGYQHTDVDFELKHLAEEQTCELKQVVEPLQWISDCLMQRVETKKTMIHHMFLAERTWNLSDESHSYSARNVVLAVGALPSILNYPGVNVIPFDTAIDKEKLSLVMNPDETYGVFGSSHSAMIILRHLVESGAKKIINFYRSPCRYAIEMEDWILFDNTGLKGETALWAREHIDGVLPENLFRCNTSAHNMARFLPECDRVIYCVGFERRKSLVIGDYEEACHNPHSGIIAPGLFGFGIAYPELKMDPLGNKEWQVGLWKFMVYLNKVMPIWLKYTA